MRVGHFSDLHGRYKVLDQILDSDLPDVWLSTGDFFPNKTRGELSVETRWQTNWWGHKSPSVVSRLRGRPILVVDGNHDFVNLASLLRRDGVQALGITPDGLDWGGLRWAGFREIPYIEGTWMGEETQRGLTPLAYRALASGPDVLVTHAPPRGVLDEGEEGYGVDALAEFLPDPRIRGKVRHHFFGHVHATGGQDQEKWGIQFHNSATCLRIIEI